MAVEKKYTVGDVTAIFFILYASILSLIDWLLLFLDALPFVGMPVSAVAAFYIDLLAILTIFLPLYMIGAYKGKSGLANAIATGLFSGAAAIPLLENLPIILGGTLFVIVRSRINDAEEAKHGPAKEEAEKRKAANDNEKKERSVAVARKMLTQRNPETRTSAISGYYRKNSAP